MRDGTADDVQAMYELDLLCFEEPFRFDLRAMRRFATSPRAIVLIAEDADVLAGFVIVHVRRGVADVVTLDVDPDRRRQGVARDLMVETESRARSAGASWIGLHVFVGNAAAIRFYEKNGYEASSVEAGYYGDGLDALVYRKALG